ncbi:MAG: MoxR family ATPase [Bacteroidetes bacterium]|nr:MoxR family ATPase [Bacteroidota bacterium]
MDLLRALNDADAVKALSEARSTIEKELHKVIVGQDEIIQELLIALFARGHCLLVGIPGLAKTLLISTLSKILDLDFSRIQFTPDLMPSDIVGTEVIEENMTTGNKQFRFVKGPLFANMVLADEINRTPPKTQSALLEAMQEHKVTAAGTTYTLSEPFFVLATQNPIEQEGTYPLPEAQLDRFMFNIWIDYPNVEQEVEIVKSTTGAKAHELQKVMSGEEIMFFQSLVRRVPVSDAVIQYAVKLVTMTRPKTPAAPEFVNTWLNWGAGPRASQYLILGAKTRAVLDGRFTPDIDDVRSVVRPVLRHRLINNFNAEADGISTLTIIDRLMKELE